ncbi:hypothetical protein BH11CYA1_BH11CYA1_49220 [soil metagenome]
MTPLRRICKTTRVKEFLFVCSKDKSFKARAAINCNIAWHTGNLFYSLNLLNLSKEPPPAGDGSLGTTCCYFDPLLQVDL